MLASMLRHFINQLKFSRSFYLEEYDHVEQTSREGIKKNIFGARVSLYLKHKSEHDNAFFETELGKKLTEEIEDIVQVEKITNDEKRNYRIYIDHEKIDSESNELDIMKATDEFDRYYQMMDIHSSNALQLIMIRFESFLTDYFKWLIEKFPSCYFNNKSIPYSELIKYDFDKFQHELVNEVACEILQGSVDDWFKLLRNHKFDIEPIKEYITILKEINCRRNLVVHNNGVINRIYIESTNCRPQDFPIGKRLEIDKKYIMASFNTVMILVYGILHASLKADENETKDFIESAFAMGFEHMMQNDWEISQFIFGILAKDKNQIEYERTLAKINYWISCKNIGSFNTVKDEINTTDFSDKNVSIQMAKAMLLEQYDLGLKLIDEAIVARQLYPDLVKTWPIFIQFRLTPYYEAFKEKYATQMEDQLIDRADLGKRKEVDAGDEICELKETDHESVKPMLEKTGKAKKSINKEPGKDLLSV